MGNENDDWVLTLSAIAGNEPPTEYAEILEFLGQLAPDDVLAAVRAAQPVGQVNRYRVPSNRWRRYDKMRRFPDGLIVIGDAICSFNPVYGQGMTMAALDAMVLRDCLRDEPRHLPRRFYHDSAKRSRWPGELPSVLISPCRKLRDHGQPRCESPTPSWNVC